MIRFLLCLLVLPTLAHAASVERLRCEYLDSPLGVDSTAPRLSWEMRSNTRGDRQTAYQVVVTAGDHTCWDSGRVDSDQNAGVAYAGEPLRSAQRYAWKVRVWDRDGKPSDYSSPATWEMGLLDPAE